MLSKLKQQQFLCQQLLLKVMGILLILIGVYGFFCACGASDSYIFFSEVFRYLACLKNCVYFLSAEIEASLYILC